MKGSIPGAALVSLSLVTASAQGDDLKEFHCGRSLEAPGGLPQLVVDPDLHVLDQTSANPTFDPGPAPPGTAIKSIFCARYKVVQAGYPLTIYARDAGGKTRIAVLELEDGQLRLRQVGEAGFTPDMVRRIQLFLDAAMPQFGKTAAAR